MNLFFRLGLLCVLFLTNSVYSATRIRIVAANLSSGSDQKYDLGHGIRILRGLKPHIVLLQEFNYLHNTQADFQHFAEQVFELDPDSEEVKEASKKNVYFFREAEQGGLPNGILSRFPILETGEEEDEAIGNRDFAWARVDLPGPHELLAYSLHLKAGKHVTTRVTEAKAMVKVVNEAKAKHADDFIVVGGDFNTKSASEQTVSILKEVLSNQHDPAGSDGSHGTNSSRKSHYDWVLPDSKLDALNTPVKIGNQTFPDGLVFDSRNFSSLSAVPGVNKSDSAASGMQHMAVVKDFVLAN